MQPLTVPATDMILQRLEALTTELEENPSSYAFYLWVLMAEAFVEAKPTVATLAAVRRCVTLARRMHSVREDLLPNSVPWRPLSDLIKFLHSEATRLTTLYGTVRPTCIPRRRELRQEFQVAFRQATGTVYQAYGSHRTAKERTMMTDFWEEALHAALTRFQEDSTPETLDNLLACLPAWSDRSHERWTKNGWREPSPAEAMQLVTAYVQLGEACKPTLVGLIHTAFEQTPLVEREHVAPAVEQEYADRIQNARAQLSALPRPKDVPKTRHAQLRNDRAHWQKTLDSLLHEQEAAIAGQVKRSVNIRQRITTLAKMVDGYPEVLIRKFGKTIAETLPHIVWIYDWDRQGDDTWRQAKRDGRRFVRDVRQAHAAPTIEVGR